MIGPKPLAPADSLPVIGTVAAIAAHIAATLEAGDRAAGLGEDGRSVMSAEDYVRRAKELLDVATKNYDVPPR